MNVAEAPWSGAPTVLLNKPTSSGAGAGSLEYWTLAREFHRRVQDMRENLVSATRPGSPLRHKGAAKRKGSTNRTPAESAHARLK